MKILCGITGWDKREVLKGRFHGRETCSRLALGASNWNWIVGIQRTEDSPLSQSKYFGNMACLLPYLFSNFGAEAVHAVVNSLGEKVSVTITVPKFSSEDDAKKFGHFIDDTYRTSFMRNYPPTVCKDIFGCEDVEESSKDDTD
jgi:hypothetical protein